MDLPELPEHAVYPGSRSLPAEDWQQSLQSLRLLFLGTLATLLLLSGSLNLYLYKQSNLARQELDKTVPIVTQMSNDYNEKSVPLINEFLAKLNTFARTNPDFSPILSRHLNATAGLTQPLAPGAPATPK